MSKSPSKKKSTGQAAPEGSDEPFEKQLARLEKLVAHLEEGDLGLEEALSSFEEGIQLTRSLMKRLDDAEKRIEVLLEKAGGGLETREISVDDLEKAATRGSLRHDSTEKEDDEDEED